MEGYLSGASTTQRNLFKCELLYSFMGEVSPISVAHAQDLMREITNFRALLYQLEQDLKRVRVTEKEVINKETGERELKYVEEKYGKPRLSEEGIQDIISILRTHLNPNTFYSYTKEDAFNKAMWNTMDSIVIRLWDKRKAWNIEDSDYPVLCAMIRDMLESANRHAILGNFADFTGSSSSRQENIIMESSQKSGVLGGIFGSSQKPQR